jgi:hypothetical protein
MRRLFVGAFYLIALSPCRNQWHERVLSFSRVLVDCRLYAVDEVLAEFLTACSGSGSRIRAQGCDFRVAAFVFLGDYAYLRLY